MAYCKDRIGRHLVLCGVISLSVVSNPLIAQGCGQVLAEGLFSPNTPRSADADTALRAWLCSATEKDFSSNASILSPTFAIDGTALVKDGIAQGDAIRAWKRTACSGGTSKEIDAYSALLRQVSPSALGLWSRCLQETSSSREGLQCGFAAMNESEIRLSTRYLLLEKVEKKAKVKSIRVAGGSLAGTLKVGTTIGANEVTEFATRDTLDSTVVVSLDTDRGGCALAIPPSRISVQYGITLWPEAELPTEFVETKTWYRSDEDCAASLELSPVFTLSREDSTISGVPSVGVTTSNCGSFVRSVKVSEDRRSAEIGVTVKGCGSVNFPFGIRNCFGRGWLGLQVSLTGKTWSSQSLPFAKVTGDADPSRPITYSYPFPIPHDARNIKWHFRVVVTGGQSHIAVTDEDYLGASGVSVSLLPPGTLELRLREAL